MKEKKEKTIKITETQFGKAVEKAMEHYHEAASPACNSGSDLMMLSATMALHVAFAGLIKCDLFGEEN